MKIKSGNLNDKENKEHNGWFIGHFIEKDSIFNNNQFEVKWGVHSKDEKQSIPKANKNSKTLSILISGKVSIGFPKDDEKVVLSEAGDYVFWGPDIYHTYDILEDSTVLTVRWPSLPDDQISLED